MRRLLDAQRQHGKPELPSYVDVIRVPPVASTLPAPENDDSVPGRPLPIDATHYYDTSTKYSAAVRSSDTSSSYYLRHHHPQPTRGLLYTHKHRQPVPTPPPKPPPSRRARPQDVMADDGWHRPGLLHFLSTHANMSGWAPTI